VHTLLGCQGRPVASLPRIALTPRGPRWRSTGVRSSDRLAIHCWA